MIQYDAFCILKHCVPQSYANLQIEAQFVNRLNSFTWASQAEYQPHSLRLISLNHMLYNYVLLQPGTSKQYINNPRYFFASHSLHFSLNYKQGSKPWRYTGKEENMDREDIKMLIAKWWDIYNDESLDFKAEDHPVPAGDTCTRPSIMAALPEPTVSYIPAPSAA